MKRVWGALFLAGLTATPAAAGDIDVAEVERRVERLMERPDMVGLAIAVIEDGELIMAEGFGETTRGSGDPVTADTVFRWASLSKSVAAAATLSVGVEGHFGLTSPAEAHAPSLKLPDGAFSVTLEDVLTHRTGMDRHAYDDRLERGESARRIRAELKNKPRICDPGSCFRYQNVAYDATAEMIETATGLPYKAVINERIFEPLGMATASVTLEGLIRSKSHARPHNLRGQEIKTVKTSYYRIPAAAGVNSSVTDLAKWMQAQMMLGPSLYSDLTKTALHYPRVKTPREEEFMADNFHALTDAHYGLGWRIYDYEGHRVIGHRGAVQGYRALMLIDPDRSSGVAVMWNTPHTRPVGLQMEVFDQLYGLPKRDWMRLGPEKKKGTKKTGAKEASKRPSGGTSGSSGHSHR